MANAIEKKAKWRWVNPYVHLMDGFPGRIFSLAGDVSEEEQLRKIISTSKRVFVELGSGSGQHLILQAKRNPDATFFGFELRYKRAVRTLEKADKAGTENLYVLRTDFSRLEEVFKPNSLSGIYINFPDPWDKRKQHKHRVLRQGILERAGTLLVSGGILSVKTDHRDYFRSFIAETAQAKSFRLLRLSENLGQSEFAADNVPSEFELLFRNKGIPICCALLERV